MDRVSANGYVTISGRRTFRDKNPGAGVPFGTNFAAQFMAGVQESLVGVEEAVGITPADATIGSPDPQLLQAIRIIAAGNPNAVVTASGTLVASNAGLVLVNATAGGIALTLPAVAGANGQPLRFQFVRVDASANAVTITPHAGDTVLLGNAPIALSVGAVVTLHGDGGTQWVQLGRSTGAQTFTTSGTFAAPAAQGWVSAIAGGGGGGNGYSTSPNFNAGGGGGSGQWVLDQLVTFVPGTSYTVTIPSGGAAGASGGALSLGSLLTLSGGGPGVAATSVTPGAGASPVAAGATSGGQGAGVGASSVSPCTMPGGRGGPSPFGAYGAGGDGGLSTATAGAASGSAGGGGFLFVRW